MFPRSKSQWLAAGLVGLTACFGKSCPTDPVGCLLALLAVENGADAVALEGTPAGEPVVLRLAEACADADGPLSGLELLLSFGGGGLTGAAAMAPAGTELRVRTDANGRVRVGSWVLARGANEIRASLVDSSRKADPIKVTGLGVPGDSLTMNTGPTQLPPVSVGASVPPPSVSAGYQGRAVSGVAFEFTASDPADVVTKPIDTTGIDGKAGPGGWTVGNRAGVHELVATPLNPVVKAPPVAYRVQVNPGPAANLLKVAGDSQRVAAGSAVAVAPRVRVTDQHQNPVPNVTVQFAVGSGGGAVVGGTQTTDAEGFAAPERWTLGPTPGPYQLLATATGLSGSPATFTATALPPSGPPDSIFVVAGKDQQGVVGTELPVRPRIRVVDAQGRPVPGVAIRFEIGAAGGTIRGGNQTTDASGEAQADGWVLGSAAGTQYVLIYGPTGLKGSPASCLATALPGAPSAFLKLAGDGQTAVAGGLVGTRPAARVVDRFGNGVAGVTVTFSTPTAGSSVAGPIQVTDAQGVARVGSWRLSTAPGTNQLLATVTPPNGVTITPPTVTFTATGVVGEGAPRAAASRPPGR